MNGTAYKRPGKTKDGKELTKKDFVKNKWGRIVSLKKHKTARKERRLEKHGFFAEKGKFGYVKKGKKSRRKSMKRGGNSEALKTQQLSHLFLSWVEMMLVQNTLLTP